MLHNGWVNIPGPDQEFDVHLSGEQMLLVLQGLADYHQRVEKDLATLMERYRNGRADLNHEEEKEFLEYTKKKVQQLYDELHDMIRPGDVYPNWEEHEDLTEDQLNVIMPEAVAEEILSQGRTVSDYINQADGRETHPGGWE